MEPSAALQSIETSLRLIVELRLPEWQSQLSQPKLDALTEKHREEHRRRDGVVASDRLLDYTDTYLLTDLILKNWELFKATFDDKRRTEAFFGVLADVRNAIAHSRDLAPFERELLSGVAGHIRNMVAMDRGKSDPSAAFYPLIERASDAFNEAGARTEYSVSTPLKRLNVGDVVVFELSAYEARAKSNRWTVDAPHLDEKVLWEGSGSDVRAEIEVTDEMVHEGQQFRVRLRNDSPHHRWQGYSWQEPYDDEAFFSYAVNPPA